MKKLGLLTIFLVLCSTSISVAQTVKGNELEIIHYDAKGCLQMPYRKKVGISNETEFLKRVRNDANRGRCLKDLEKIDFEKNSLFGVNINSGYCRYPLGLKFTATKDVENKQFVVNISYLKPNGVCRALSSYDLWLILPKTPSDYGIRYEITEIEGNER